jgi:putative ATP-binding cassette transporter
MTVEEFQGVLERVCLPDLFEKAGGLDAPRDWSKVFSLGEQQRISFARILISGPRFVFLDEATSAVDVPTEASLYRTLIETGVTYVSVGHRETILCFHDRALRLNVGGEWELLDRGGIETTVVEPLGAARGPERPGELIAAAGGR